MGGRGSHRVMRGLLCAILERGGMGWDGVPSIMICG